MPEYVKPTIEALENRFAHHSPVGDQTFRYSRLRAAALSYAKLIVELTPASPEQARAIDRLDETMMLANAAIARTEPRGKIDPASARS